MLYQRLLMGDTPYFINTGRISDFENHRHPEFELHYCRKGSYQLLINHLPVPMKEGDMVIVGSMIPHEVPKNPDSDADVLVIGFGPVLLMGNYMDFCRIVGEKLVCSVDNGEFLRMRELFEETAKIAKSTDDGVPLLLRGNLYAICGHILRVFAASKEAGYRKVRNMEQIDGVYELIRSHYAEPLTVEYVAERNGYSKSNFCRVFKRITGNTFHDILNQRRVEVAGFLLVQTNLDLEEIAQQVGFLDAKCFCRVFKKYTGKTPGTYRKQ